MRYSEISVFVVYLLFMLGVGIYFFFKDRGGGEKQFFLGGRRMGAWVGALSAGASDMSAWVLMGLPTAIYAYGLGEVWISVGLAVGYAASWIFEAPRLRKFSIAADDAITIPQYLSNRLGANNRLLQVLCALVFLVAYTIYTAASIKGCGILFHQVIGLDTRVAMYIAAFIVVGYTFLGGFSAVCWTDFFQGLLILGAMLTAPLVAVYLLPASGDVIETPDYWNGFADWRKIVSGLAWGLGYFGMPHIIIRFMSLESQKSLKKSAKIGISWTVLIVITAALIGLIGRMKLGYSEEIVHDEVVFVQMVRILFPSVISGILLSAVLAASMSTADSQLLSASSALSSDVYKPIIRNNRATDRELLWIGRIVVLAVAVVAMIIASAPGADSIMKLVSNAWGVFGAAFGPTIMLSLFWKRFNYTGALAGIFCGALADILWLVFLADTHIYELLPGFAAGLFAAVTVTLLTPQPNQKAQEIFDKAIRYEE